jgi:hypothetical protein
LRGDVILGASWNYTIDQLNIFVKSWKMYCEDTRLIMIMSPKTDNETIHWLCSHGVEIHVGLENKEYQLFSAKTYSPSNIAYSRYFRYYEFLYENCENVENVFLTDVRDVAFQGNIFELINDSALHCFIEDQRYTIGTHSGNNNAMKIQYGKKIAKEFDHLPIICSGTTLGDYKSIMEYLLCIMNQRRLNTGVRKDMITVDCDGLDQAMHMYILHNNIISNTKHKNGDGVATMGIMNSEDITILPNKKVAVYNNKVAPVIHQWDRHRNIELHLKNLYV